MNWKKIFYPPDIPLWWFITTQYLIAFVAATLMCLAIFWR